MDSPKGTAYKLLPDRTGDWVSMSDWGSLHKRVVRGRVYYSLRFPLKGEGGRAGERIEINNRRELDGTTTRFRDEADALQLLSHIRVLAVEVGGRKALARYAPRSAKIGLVPEHIERFLAELAVRSKVREVSQHTLRTYRSWMRPDGPFQWWTNFTIPEIRYCHIRDWKLELAGKYSPKALRDYVQALKTFLKWAIREEIIDRLPAFPRTSVPRKGKEILRPDEQRVVLAAIEVEIRGIFLLMALGVRPNSARAVQAQDYDRGFFTIRRAAQSPHKGARVVEWEKQGRWRYVPSTEILARWIRTCRSRAAGPELLFPDPAGGGLLPHDRLRRIWKGACEQALGKYVPLYRGTKHSFATGKLVEGFSKDQVAEFLGISRQVIDEYALWARQLNTPLLGEDIATEALRGSTLGKPERRLH
jgi:site-specific recombinase XerD